VICPLVKKLAAGVLLAAVGLGVPDDALAAAALVLAADEDARTDEPGVRLTPEGRALYSAAWLN
jgi:hypothetical protein